MSDTSQGPGWWQASDGKWYAPGTGTPLPPPPLMTGPQTSGGGGRQPRQGRRAGRGVGKGCGYTLLAGVGLIIVIIVIVVIASSGSKNKITATGTATTLSPLATSADTAGASATDTTPPTTAAKVEHVGGMYSVTYQGATATVTLAAVTDPAPPANSFEPAPAGSRLIGTKFTITGVSGTFAGDINITTSVIGTDSQTYSTDLRDMAGCTNFASGEYSVTAGAISTGCAVFALPAAVKVATVRFSPSDGFEGDYATWMVP